MTFTFSHNRKLSENALTRHGAPRKYANKLYQLQEGTLINYNVILFCIDMFIANRPMCT